MHHIAQVKCFLPIIGVLVGVSLSSCNAAGAFKAKNLTEQQITILGTWNCIFKIGQKTIQTDKFQYSFLKNNTLKSDLRVGGRRVVTLGVWRIDQASMLVFPGKKDITTQNLKTGSLKNERLGKTSIFNIEVLTSNRLVFSSAKRGKTASCRR